jgi:hypothetical protein
MTLKKLASLIAKREGKLKQVSIGNVREIIGIMSDLVYEYENDYPPLGHILYVNGFRRAKRAKAKKKK